MNIPSFEIVSPQHAAVAGPLTFATVRDLLENATPHIGAGEVTHIDLARVESVDSAGLALLIEWQSLAHASQGRIEYENIPDKMMQLAHLSDLDELLTAGGSATTEPAAAR